MLRQFESFSDSLGEIESFSACFNVRFWLSKFFMLSGFQNFVVSSDNCPCGFIHKKIILVILARF